MRLPDKYVPYHTAEMQLDLFYPDPNYLGEFSGENDFIVWYLLDEIAFDFMCNPIRIHCIPKVGIAIEYV